MFLLESLFSFFLDFEKLFLMNLKNAKFNVKEIKIAIKNARYRDSWKSLLIILIHIFL